MRDTDKTKLITELRRLADYAENEARGANVVTGANIGDAISLMLDQPGGDHYTAVHSQIVAAGSDKILKELENLHTATTTAQSEAVSCHNEIKCYREKCHALAVAARTEAEFVNNIPDADSSQKRNRRKHISYKQAISILENLNVPKTRKTLLRWTNGTNTPDDFTPECMTTVEAFANWAKIYANREKSKINVNNALRIDNPNNDRMIKYR